MWTRLDTEWIVHGLQENLLLFFSYRNTVDKILLMTDCYTKRSMSQTPHSSEAQLMGADTNPEAHSIGEGVRGFIIRCPNWKSSRKPSLKFQRASQKSGRKILRARANRWFWNNNETDEYMTPQRLLQYAQTYTGSSQMTALSLKRGIRVPYLTRKTSAFVSWWQEDPLSSNGFSLDNLTTPLDRTHTLVLMANTKLTQ